MKPPVCRTCGGAVVNGNLSCSKACGQAPKAAHDALSAEGFVQDTDTPNIYRKDGIAVTLEACNHVGLSKTVQAHAHAAAIHAEAGLAGESVHRSVEGAA